MRTIPSPPQTPRAVYHWARRHDWTEAEAAGWAAWTAGLAIVDGEHPMGSWTLREVEHLIFLRATAERWR